MHMNIEDIMKTLPHRPPFLLVDRIIELIPGQRATGIKNITINEPFFPGHFPDKPVMPGVLMVEAMAQVGACAILADEKCRGLLPYFAGIDHVRFKRMALPGDILLINTELTAARGNYGRGKGIITIDDKVACQGEFMFHLA